MMMKKYASLLFALLLALSLSVSAAADSSSPSWAYCPRALRRASSTCRRYCWRSKNAEVSPLTASRNSVRWMQRSRK